MQNGEGAGTAAYLVMLHHVLVAEDIAQTVADYASGAPVVRVATEAEALSALDRLDRLAVAFLGQAPRAHEASPLAREIAARGGRVVLIGEEAEEEGARLGFAVLARPFSTADVLAHLAEGRG